MGEVRKDIAGCAHKMVGGTMGFGAKAWRMEQRSPVARWPGSLRKSMQAARIHRQCDCARANQGSQWQEA